MAASNQNKEKPFDWRMFGWRLLFTIAIGCLAALILPSRFTEELGAQKIAKLAAPLVGYFYPMEYRDDITVLLIDDEALSVKGYSWPPPFDFYADLLRLIDTPADMAPARSYHPRAVFFDIVFEHEQEKERLAEFETALDAINASSLAHRKSRDGPPVVFLAARLGEHNDLSINKDLEHFSGATKAGIEYSPNEVDRITWTYPLFLDRPTQAPSQAEHLEIRQASTNGRASAASLPPKRRSAALAIYEDAYGLPEPTPYTPEKPPSSTMVLTWGLDTAESGLLWKAEEDEEKKSREDTWLSADSEATYRSMYCTSDEHDRVLFARAEARSIMRSLSRPLCVFHRTIHANQLSNMTPGEYREAFDNKVVMIGTSLRYSNDIVVSPLHDRIPGVFLHAMALDNLLTSNGHYQENWEAPGSPFDEHWPRFAALCVIGLVPVALVRALKELARDKYREWRRSRPGPKPHKLHRTWRRRKYLDAAVRFLIFALSGLALIILATCLLVLGQALVHVPYLAVSHLVACAMAVEWFDWGSDLANWVFDVKE
ncbi:CHASE2 domain-containing protein [Caballeronia sp. INDeC2]|uniref:CHASE2 domain-containing protein n=1 Tax=Caballeronia sp. INDeC2 TaxID=2921747 RepID=UPI0020293115|nr:CHASE2 domain-containing protein [Caballeronia sp. INDeC2]